MIKLSFCSLVAFILLSNCTSRKAELLWDKSIYKIGSQSSPRTADLNGDGILDIVMGAAQMEFQETDFGILALDGQTGEMLWRQGAHDQVLGSATLYDITGDGVSDVVIGGRTGFLKAVDGKTGELLWVYEKRFEEDPILKYARFNFYSGALVPDQNNDGLQDYLTINGGNSKAAPYTMENRYPGVLMLFDIKTGEIIAADTMPDGMESYMSPLCFAQPGSDDLKIVFGTGGETLDGNLYLADFSDLLEGNLTNAKIIASDKGHGFIAPPALADISQDGYYDIVAISQGSAVFAIDGKDQSLLWEQKIEGTESSNAFAVGYLNEDKIPDFFTFLSKGVWPDSKRAVQVVFDGKDGSIVYQDSIGCTGFSSPVVYDLDGDGYDEAIISVNEFDCSQGFNLDKPSGIETRLITIDFQDGTVRTIDQANLFKNIFTTPWIGDLDGDGYLDIIHCQYYSAGDLISFLGMNMRRISSPFKMRREMVWGAYMGSKGDGIFPTNQSQ